MGQAESFKIYIAETDLEFTDMNSLSVTARLR
jgi:hypothetical protein